MRKRIFAALIATLLLLAACAAPTTTPADPVTPATPATPAAPAPAPPPEAPAEPLRFEMLVNFNGTEPPRSTFMFDHFEENMNAIIDVTWIPTQAYNDLWAAQMAAGSLPHVAVVRDPMAPIVIEAARSGMLWPLDAYLNPDWEAFNRLNEMVLETIRVDGVLYAFPREREMVRAGAYFRQDWLDNLGLDVPTNMEEIMEVLRAFTEDDPNGDGSETFGLSIAGRSLSNLASTISPYFGGTPFWTVDAEGNFIHEIFTPEYMMALEFYREAYTRGFIIPDFAVLQDSTVPFAQGRAGLLIQTTVGDAVNAQRDLQSLFPDATVGATMDIRSPDGSLRIRAHTGYTGALVFPRTSIRTQDELEAILRFWNELGSRENAMLINNGAEGLHFDIVDGYIVRSSEQNAQFQLDLQDMSQFHPFGFDTWFDYPVRQATDLGQHIADSIRAFGDHAIANPAAPFISDTQVRLGTTLSDILSDAEMRFVLGHIDEAGLQAAIDEWWRVGGEQVTAEFTAQWRAVN